jgi:hypothetical protein
MARSGSIARSDIVRMVKPGLVVGRREEICSVQYLAVCGEKECGKQVLDDLVM